VQILKMSEINNRYIAFTKLLLITVFIVIIAGSIVRTTQSGMGCPDWPTCFGNIIPPTKHAQVEFHPNQHYKKGQFIIYNDSLKYAKEAFTSTDTFNPGNWQQYEKHNYATFNVYRTWVEYINRLCTGVLGILILIHVIWSYKNYFKTTQSIFWLSCGLLAVTGFEAWLGKVVVDTNLEVVKITAHMFFALVLVLIPIIILHKLEAKPKVSDNFLKWLALAGIIVLLEQIFLGTEVRQQVDVVSKSLNYAQRNLWLLGVDGYLDAHKAVAGITAFCCILIFWRSISYPSLRKTGVAILIVVLAEVALGLIMAYINIPAFAQPVHLLLSSILFALLFSCRLNME
jgi:cytochrome c oxidase assembly protein subunit 15